MSALRRFGLLLLLAPASLAAQDSLRVIPLWDAADWIRPGASFAFRLSRAPLPGEGRLAVLVGPTDLSALFGPSGDRLSYLAGTLPLPVGKSEVTVFLVQPDGQWRELARASLQVLTAGGLQQAQLLPKLAFSNKGQVAEGHGAAPPPPRGQYQDLALNAGFQTVHGGSGWSLRSQANFVGVTNRLEALRYGERQNQAPKFDLSDYLVSLERGRGSLSFGHVSYGGNRHLINGFASRGVSGALRLGPTELSLAAVNGSSIVGWSNPVGFTRAHHRIASGTIALEAKPSRPGLLRVELTALDGSVLPQAGYTQGVVNDAETSRGLGVRMLAADPDGRLRLEAGLARSRFHNPQDSALEQGAALVPVRPTSRNARYLDATLDLLRARPLLRGLPVSLSANLQHEQVDPLFRGVAASPQADVLHNAAGITGALGALALQATLERSHDNLAGIASILTTRTRGAALNLSFPTAALARSTSNWFPVLSYALTQSHQFGAGVPPNSGFSATHVPDQLSTNQMVAAQWQTGKWHGGYQLAHSYQDNRETGREQSDFGNWTHGLTWAATPVASLDLGLDLGLEQADNKELNQRTTTRRGGATLDWRARPGSALALAWSLTRTADALHSQLQRASVLRVELSQRVTLARFSANRMGGQLFIRYARQSGGLLLPSGVMQPLRQWSLNSGASLTVF